VFTLAQRREIKKIAKSRPAEHGLPFSRWSLAKLADFLVAEGVVEDISHEGLRELLRAENVSFQAVKTWKASADPDYAAKKARVDHLYAVADGEAAAASNVEIAYTPANSSWMNRLECQFTALREFTLNGTGHATHREQGSMIRRYIAWRNRHIADPRLRRIVKRASAA
jgi:hypothetical protein